MNRGRRATYEQGRRRERDALNAADVWAMLNDPMLRMQDIHGSAELAQQLIVNSRDAELAELFSLVQQQQAGRALIAGDPFYSNYPASGVLPPLGPGLIPLAAMPMGGVLSVPVTDVTRNVLVVGPTGGGKTTWLRAAIAAILKGAAMNTVVAFDRKHDLVDCEMLTRYGLPVYVLNWHELQLAMLQPVPGMAPQAYSNVLVQLLGKHLSLMASRRLLLETLQLLYRRQRPAGEWPTLSEWVELVESIHANSLSRLGQYREATLYALKGIRNELGRVVNHAASSMLEQLFSTPGCFVIQTGGLGVDAASLLASVFINWIYEHRGGAGHPEQQGQAIFVLDDALPLITGSTASESEGGPSTMATWAFMGRSRGIGFVVSAQNYSLISPALRNNSNAILAFASYGRDAEELSRDVHLTREQTQRLTVIRPGEVIAIARSAWPLAVYGRVPNVP